MKIAPPIEFSSPALDYRAGLSRRREAVISSHFMDGIAQDRSLAPYSDEIFAQKAYLASSTLVDDAIIPSLLEATSGFSTDRAVAALDRARAHWRDYGLAGPDSITEAEGIAEVMFDRQFSRKANSTRSRSAVRDEVAERIMTNRRIDLVMPALPFKIACPLKSRGSRPDFAEIDFILSLHEIVRSIEIVSKKLARDAEPVEARFIVVSDGRRFDSIVNVPSDRLDQYREALEGWIGRLGLGESVAVVDYRELLDARLPSDLRERKEDITRQARRLYLQTLDPLFDPLDVEQSLIASRALEPDPENENPEGRFASLFKSLIYTLNYRSIAALGLSSDSEYPLYREMTSRLVHPFEPHATVDGSGLTKEELRRQMLDEVWQATIEYMAEIKSDRDLDVDPILSCMPGAVRWTIHAKQGQCAIATQAVYGSFVQAWAGTGFFRLTKKGAIRLCCYPVLGLEGRGAIPVFEENEFRPGGQPLFYLQKELAEDGLDGFVAELNTRLTRRRVR